MSKKNDDSAFTVKVEPPAERKKTVPRSAYSRENPSPNQFEPGVSPNPGGRAGSKPRLLSRALKARLDARAPDAIASAFHLSHGASWAQVLAAALITQAVKGDTQAARMIAEYTEPLPKQSFALGFDDGDGEESALGPRLAVHFVSSKSDLEKKYAEGRIIDAPSSPPRERDIDPTAADAEREAETVRPRGDAPLGSSPAPSPQRNTFAALAPPAPRPATPPESAQKTRERIYKKLGYPG